MPSALHLRRVLLVLAVLSLLAVVVVAPAPVRGQGAVAVTSPSPAPEAVVESGPVEVSAAVDGTDAARLLVDGVDVGPAGGGPTTVELDEGGHQLAVAVDGTPVRTWTVYAADVSVRRVEGDPLAVGVAASRPGHDGRPVLLVNPDRPALALAAAPLAAATGALVLPTGQSAVPEATSSALAGTTGPVRVLGGLDAVGPDVVSALEAAGRQVTRVGTGSPAEVAVAAARAEAVADHYTRQGRTIVRGVVVAPSEPLVDAARAAAAAAARGASLVLVDSDAPSADVLDVVAGRPLVWTAPSLPAAARDAVADAAAEDAVVDELGDPADDADGPLWIVDPADDRLLVMATVAAASGADLLADPDPDRARRVVATARPDEVVVVGAVLDPGEVTAAVIDGPDAPSAGVTSADAEQVVIASDPSAEAAAVHVALHGVEWPGTTSVQDGQVVWTAGERPQLPADVEPDAPTLAPLRITALVQADGRFRHVAAERAVGITPRTSTSPEGFLVAGGSSPAVGSGPLRTFSVEVEPATGLDLWPVAEQVERILLDPTRGWTARGARSLQRVGDPSLADIRVVVARPATVDEFCGRVGLGTGGRLSCWDGRRTMLNLDRWTTGVSPFHTDLEVYRTYLVSHEVGHGLGYGHVSCPAAGALAPVMMQQSKGLGACVANGWPYPHG